MSRRGAFSEFVFDSLSLIEVNEMKSQWTAMTKRAAMIRLAAWFLGLAAFFAGGTVRADLIVDGGFEQGANGQTNPPGWTFTPAVSGSSAFVKDTTLAIFSSYSGVNDYWFGATGTTFDTITQAVPTTTGQSYTLSYFLQIENDGLGGPPDEFQVRWNGAVISDLIVGSPFYSILPYEQFTFSVTGGPGATTNLSFAGIEHAAYWQLDNVSLAAVPEPSSLVLATFAAVGLGLAGWRRQRKALAHVPTL
jgi:hypothetical protein